MVNAIAPRPYGIGDDGAMICNGQIISQDTMVEAFILMELLSPADVGYKIVAVNALGILQQWEDCRIGQRYRCHCPTAPQWNGSRPFPLD